jgi:uncharacterized protein DUF5658
MGICFQFCTGTAVAHNRYSAIGEVMPRFVLSRFLSEKKMSLPVGSVVRRLLIFNLLLQVFDGFLSYQVLSAGAAEANPLIHAVIISWGAIWGLLYHKALACLLLVLIFAFRHRRQLLTVQALAITASVYTCFGLFCLWELFFNSY